MCYQPDPEQTRRVVTPIPDGYKCDGAFGVTHMETDTVWELMELLQCHVATWRMPSDESSEQGLASQRLLAATARMLARVTEASIAAWQTEHEGDACRAYLAEVTKGEPDPRDTMEVLRRIFRHDGYDNFTRAVQGLEADHTITPEVATALRQIATHLQREGAEEEETAPEPAEEPPHAVDAFWSLAQYFQKQGVNTAKVAHDAVTAMTPAT